MSRHLLLAPLLALALALSAPLAAQTVRGTLHEEGSGAPVAGTLVVLLDGAGEQRKAALTDAAGRFLLAAPGPGSYTLRAERVGHATTTLRVEGVREGETRDVRMAVAAQAVALEGISVQGKRRRCEVRPESALETATLWEEARKVLNAAAWAEASGVYRHRVERYERDLDPELRVLAESRRTDETGALRPFESVPVESLAEGGFVQTTAEGTFYYAPDAAVLLSDEFLDTHCYHVAEGEDGLVGLAFEPVPGRRVPEIRGVLWLDRKSAELRHLEYGYVNLPLSVPTDRLGGRVEFRRLPTGAWIVERWALRMPQLRVVERTGLAVGGTPAARRTEAELAGIREVGGEIAGTYTRDGARVTEVVRMVVEGTVFDSAGATPLEGATVFLSGTHFSARTDAEGRFRIEGVPQGDYLASFAHPALQGAEGPPRPRGVSVRPGEAATVALLAPPLRVAAAAPPAAGEEGVRLEELRVVGTSEFASRARSGNGRYLTREEIEERRPHSTVELFRSFPGVEVVGGSIRLRGTGAPVPTGSLSRPGSANVGSVALPPGANEPTGPAVSCRGGPDCQADLEVAKTRTVAERPADCTPTLYLDGVEWHPVGGDLNALPPGDIEGIEFYARASLAPGRYKKLDSECGIVLIWTRAGR